MQRQMAEEFPPPESEDYGTGERTKGHSTSVSDFSFLEIKKRKEMGGAVKKKKGTKPELVIHAGRGGLRGGQGAASWAPPTPQPL